MTEAQQRVKVGDVLHIKPQTMGYLPIVVMRVSDSGVEGREWTSHPIKDVHFVAWDDLVLPDPPKAKPGVRYESPYPIAPAFRIAIGTSSGRLTFDCVNTFAFDETWREVPE